MADVLAFLLILERPLGANAFGCPDEAVAGLVEVAPIYELVAPVDGEGGLQASHSLWHTVSVAPELLAVAYDEVLGTVLNFRSVLNLCIANAISEDILEGGVCSAVSSYLVGIVEARLGANCFVLNSQLVSIESELDLTVAVSALGSLVEEPLGCILPRLECSIGAALSVELEPVATNLLLGCDDVCAVNDCLGLLDRVACLGSGLLRSKDGEELSLCCGRELSVHTCIAEPVVTIVAGLLIVVDVLPIAILLN